MRVNGGFGTSATRMIGVCWAVLFCGRGGRKSRLAMWGGESHKGKSKGLGLESSKKLYSSDWNFLKLVKEKVFS